MKSRVLLAFVVACALLVSQLDAQDLRELDEESNKLTCFKCTSNNDPTDNYCYEINALTKTKQGCDYCQVKKSFSPNGQFSVKRSCVQSAPKNNNELNKWVTSKSASVFLCNDVNLCNNADFPRFDSLPVKQLNKKSGSAKSSKTLVANTTASSSLASTGGQMANSTSEPVNTANTTVAQTRFFVLQMYNRCCSEGLGFGLLVYFVICLCVTSCAVSFICLSSCCSTGVETIEHSKTRRRSRKAKKAKKSRASQTNSSDLSMA